MPLPPDDKILFINYEEIEKIHKAVNMRANVMNQPLTLNSLLPILKAIGLIDDDFNESELIDKLLNDT